MQKLTVALGERSYPIFIGQGHLGSDTQADNQFVNAIKGTQVCVVTNETIAPLYLQSLLDRLPDSLATSTHIVLPDGEQYKSMTYLNSIFDHLLEQRHSRSTTLIALGGGVIGDMTGFAAACYQRGVDFIQVPTTLLSQVDSSVGGKTAVNHPKGKNMIGAFYQPNAVIIDINTLDTLPDRELSAGLAEVIKYGLIRKADFFDWLELNMSHLMLRDKASLNHAIEVSCQTKAEVVALDEREQGLRAILNLGHTFGHAIEAWQSYKGWLHGEAVGAGMAMAARFSQRLGLLQSEDSKRIESVITSANLPIHAPPGIDRDSFLNLMGLDKKVANGQLRLILMNAVGSAFVSSEFGNIELQNFLQQELR